MSDSSDSAKAGCSHHDNVTARQKQKVRLPSGSDTRRVADTFHMNFKVPPFAPDDPEIWFALLEGQFNNFQITDDSMKFSQVITSLDIHHAKAVKDIIINPPNENRYNKIKSELIKRLSASQEKKVKQLLTQEELGSRKPSQFLRHLQDLAGPCVPEDFIRTIWCNRLPQEIQTILASQPSHSLEQLADLADRIQDITEPGNVAATSSPSLATSNNVPSEIAELRMMVQHLTKKVDELMREPRHSGRTDRSRPRRRSSPPSRDRTRSRSSYQRYPICWYHATFGANAHKCQKPCDFKESENAKGSR